MATVNKDFKIKSGLIVEGTTATVNGFDILTKKQADQDYIVGLIGGTATSENTPNKVVKRDANGDFAAGEITADLVGNVTGQVSSLSNHDTDDLAEGTNKYFTNQRALNATASAYDAAGSASAAQSAAASDATTKANAAKAAAEATAASDATTKANAALVDAEDYTDSAISTEVTNRNSAIATAKSQAISAAASDATTKANNALADANDYTDSSILNLNLAGTYDTLGSANAAEAAANSYTNSAISTEVTNRNSAIATAKTAAIADAKSYTDAEVAALVDSAPELLDTLNELAAAIADNPNYATDVANLVATKADKTYVDSQDAAEATARASAVTAAIATAASDATTKANAALGDAEDYTDSAISTEVTNRNSAIATAKSQAISAAASDATTKANAAEAAANGYTNNEITTALNTAQGYADTAESNANTYAEGLASSADSNAHGYANTAESNAASYTNSAINALDTDDIEEGSLNLYFTDSRAKISAGDLLAGANTQNVDITFVSGVLSIIAENGVTDSTTDDLFEGEGNLYFTNERANSAIQDTNPRFDSVNIKWFAKEIAGYASGNAGSTLTALELGNAASAKLVVRAMSNSTGHSQMSEILVTKDSNNNIAITEYAIVGTNGNLGNVSAVYADGNIQITFDPTENSTEVMVSGTSYLWND